MRPLYDDGAASATAATRDYVIKLRSAGGAPVVDVFGGKITTYRRLAEAAMARLGGVFPGCGGGLDRRRAAAGRRLPGRTARRRWPRTLCERFPFLDRRWAERLVRDYGTEAAELLAGAGTAADLGERFGWDLTEREVRWLMQREWARTAEDVLWRRTKLGLRLTEAEAARLDAFMSATADTAALAASG